MSNTRNKFISYKGRNSKPRQQNNVILVVCVGQTEEMYFNRVKLSLGKIRVSTIQDAVSPLQLVERAILEKRRGSYIQVWTVFDKDDYEDFDEAIVLADRNRIRTAYSNQAFELWYILHFERFTATCHRNQYQRLLSRHLGRQYNKTDSTIYRALVNRTDDAILNAKWGHEVLMRDRGCNPSALESSTTVYQLVEELKRWQ